MCGWTSVLTMLYITNEMQGIEYIIINLKNSGESQFGDKLRVVGYSAIAIELNNTNKDSLKELHLSLLDKYNLLKIARTAISSYIINGKSTAPDMSLITKEMNINCGVFVTLKENGQLRGCIGNFKPDKPLYQSVLELAIAASVSDYRFSKVKINELNKITIEISILSTLKKIKSINEINLGVDGIYVKKGQASGTFLPQVAKETGWTKEEFVSHCVHDKARLGWNEWNDAEIYTYQTEVFAEQQ
jgi:AmmeMemoRadiSam system protein A